MEKLINSIDRVSQILDILPTLSDKHSRDTNLYKFIDNVLIESIENIYEDKEWFTFGVFGKIYIPYVSFGAINTKDLFGLDELIIFSYYYKMKSTYKIALDLGSNIGLHSLLMSKCFDKVISFEPDEFHISIFEKTMTENSISNVNLKKLAISNTEEEVEFTRLKGNTTGSHISGSKQNVYGEVEKFNVQCTTLEHIIKKYNPDIIKMDIEGQEKNVLLSTDINVLIDVDMMIEISSEENAKAVFEYFKNSKINLFSQKKNWSKVVLEEDMPFSYKEGTLFLSSKSSMPW